MKKSMLLGSVLVCALMLFACSPTDEVDKTEGTLETPTVEQTPEVETPIVEKEDPKEEIPTIEEEVKRFKLGDTIGNDNIEVTFFNAYYTDDRNEFSDKEADKVLIIEYEYKNLAVEDGFSLFEGIHYQVYDGDGHRLQTYPATETYYGGEVSIGRVASSSEAFAVVGDQTHYEIEIGGVIVEFDLE